jgi:pimeloyl-ACP methyl ester carboxylesterase
VLPVSIYRRRGLEQHDSLKVSNSTLLSPPDRSGPDSQRFTVVTYDRRGRGDSGDTEPFAPEREYEDLAAVAAAAGTEPPFVFGHSSGAAIALRAAAAGLPTAGIAAYEAPFLNQDTPRPAVDPAEHIRELVSSGRGREAVAFWMSEVVRLPDEMLCPDTITTPRPGSSPLS